MPQWPAPRCENCSYWSRDQRPESVCKKNAPAGDGWPHTAASGWCGEWEAVGRTASLTGRDFRRDGERSEYNGID